MRVITSDLSTTAGTAGWPLVDLRTGEAIGLHFAGRWQGGDSGKFAHAYSLADILALPTLPPAVREALGLTDQELE